MPKLNKNFHKDFKVTYTFGTINGEPIQRVFTGLTFNELKAHTSALYDADSDFANIAYARLESDWDKAYGEEWKVVSNPWQKEEENNDDGN